MNITLAEQIRQLAKRGQYGHSRTSRNFYMTEGGCAFYWGNGGIVKTCAEWDRACRLLSRYHRFCSAIEGWKSTGDRRLFADNSIEIKQVSRCGNVRWIYEVAPHGDAC